MAITFNDNSTVIPASWLNDVNTVVYTYFGNGSTLNSPTKLTIASVVTPIIDSGAAGSLLLKTNNGTTIATFANDLSTTLAGPLRGSATMMSPITNSLGADVLLNSTTTFFDGPSVAQGTSGTWFVSGTVTLFSTAQDPFRIQLWDGTTIIASATTSCIANSSVSVSLSGFITSPAGNLRISARDPLSANGKILFNNSLNSKDSTITAIRIG